MRWCGVVLVIALAACSTDEQTQRITPARPVSDIVSDTVTGTAEGVWAAVKMPFEDLNLTQQDIPEKLQQLSANPYIMPHHPRCEDLRKEIAELDVLLGADICTPDNPNGLPPSRKGEYVEQGAGMAQEQTVGVVTSHTNVIPLRGVVRKISGAEKHAKAVDRAYQAGRLRRAFLKGLGESIGPECLNPPPTFAPPEKR